MKKLSILFICFFICTSCSKDDDYLRCSKCHKILTTEYKVCKQCNANICPSCMIYPSYGAGYIKQCPVCGFSWKRWNKSLGTEKITSDGSVDQ